MGIYIQAESFDKAQYILSRYPQAKQIAQPRSFDEVPVSHTVICVVDNHAFQAAGIMVDEGEFRAFTRPDHRSKTWISISKEQCLEIVTRQGSKSDANYLRNLWFRQETIVRDTDDDDIVLPSITTAALIDDVPLKFDSDDVATQNTDMSEDTSQPFAGFGGGESGGAGASGNYGDDTDASGVCATTTDDNTQQDSYEAPTDNSSYDSPPDSSSSDC